MQITKRVFLFSLLYAITLQVETNRYLLVDSPTQNQTDVLPDIMSYLQSNPDQSLSMEPPVFTPIFDTSYGGSTNTSQIVGSSQSGDQEGYINSNGIMFVGQSLTDEERQAMIQRRPQTARVSLQGNNNSQSSSSQSNMNGQNNLGTRRVVTVQSTDNSAQNNNTQQNANQNNRVVITTNNGNNNGQQQTTSQQSSNNQQKQVTVITSSGNNNDLSQGNNNQSQSNVKITSVKTTSSNTSSNQNNQDGVIQKIDKDGVQYYYLPYKPITINSLLAGQDQSNLITPVDVETSIAYETQVFTEEPKYQNTIIDLSFGNESSEFNGNCAVAIGRVEALSRQVIQYRNEKLSLEKNLLDLQTIISGNRNCQSIDYSKDFEVIKRANLSILRLLESQDAKYDKDQIQEAQFQAYMRAQISMLDKYNQSLDSLKIQILNNNNCTNLETLLKSNAASWEARLQRLQDQNQNLVKSNAELNQYVLNLQRSFTSQKDLELTIAKQNEQLAASQQRYKQLEQTIIDLRQDNNTDKLVNRINLLSTENGQLAVRLQNCNSQQQTSEQLESLRQQNTNLLGLVNNLGNQLQQAQLQAQTAQQLQDRINQLEQEKNSLQNRLNQSQAELVQVRAQNENAQSQFNVRIVNLEKNNEVCIVQRNQLQEQLKNLQNGTNQCQQVQDRNGVLTVQVFELQRENANLRGEVEKKRGVENQLQNCQQQNAQLTSQLNTCNKNLQDANNNVLSLNNQIAVLPSLRQQITSLQQTNDDLRQKNSQLLQVQDKLDSFQLIISRNDTLLRDNAELRSQLNQARANCQGQLDAAKAGQSQAINELQLCQVRAKSLQDDLDQLQRNGNAMQVTQERNRELSQTVVVLQTSNKSLQDQLNVLRGFQDNFDNLQASYNKCQEDLDQSQNRNQQLQNSVTSLQLQLSELPTLRTENQRLQQNNNSLLLSQQRFDELQNQLQNYNDLSKQIFDLRIQLQQKTEQLASCNNGQQDSLQQLQIRISNCEAERVALKTNYDRLVVIDGNVNGLQDRNRTLELQLSQLQVRLAQQDTLQNNLANLNKNLEECNQRRQVLQKDNDQLKANVELLTNSNRSMSVQVTLIPNLQRQVDDYKQQLANLQKQNDSLYILQSEINKFQTQLNEKTQLQVEKAQLQKDIDGLRALYTNQIADLEKNIQNLQNSLNLCENRSSNLLVQIGNCRADDSNLAALQNENQRLQQNLASVQNMNSDLAKRIESLRNLEIQLQLCNEEGNTKDNTIKELQLQLDGSRNQTTSLQIQVATIPSFREQIIQCQNRLTLLEDQNKSLLDINTQISTLSSSISQRDNLNQINQRLRQQISELEQNCLMQASKLQEEITGLKAQVNVCETQKSALVIEIKSQCAQDNSALQVQNNNRELNQQLIVLQTRISELQNQLSANNGINNRNLQLQAQLDQCENKYNELQITLTRTREQQELIPVYQNQIETLKDQILKLQDRNATLQSLQTQIEGFNKQFAFCVDINNSNSTLNSQLEALRIELQNQRTSCGQNSEGLQTRINILVREKSDLEAQLVSLRDRNTAIEQLQNQNRTLRDNNTALTTRVQVLQTQVEQFNDVRAQRDRCLAQEQTLSARLKQAEDKNVQLTIQVNAIPNLQAQIAKLNSDITALNQRIEQLKGYETQVSQLIIVTEQKQALERRVSELNAQLEQNRLSTEQQLAALRDQLQKLQSTNQSLQTERNTLLVNIQTCEQNSSNAGQLQQERRRLEQEIIVLQERIRNLQGQVQQLADAQRQVSTLQSDVSRLNERVLVLTQTNDNLNVRVQTLTQDNQRIPNLSTQVENLQAQINSLQVRITTLQNGNSTLTNEKQQLLQRINSLEASSRVLENELKEARLELTTRLSQVTTLQVQLDELKKNCNGNQASLVALQSTNATLRAENQRLLNEVQRKQDDVSKLTIQINTLTTQVSNCDQIKQQRDTFARQLAYVQQRLQNFRLVIPVKSQEQTVVETTVVTNDQSNSSTVNVNNESLPKTLDQCTIDLQLLRQANRSLNSRIQQLTTRLGGSQSAIQENYQFN